MDLDLKDKVIMIAAASQGIGYGIAEAAAREGARLSLCSRSREKIEQAAATLRDQFGVDARGYVCDAGDNNDIQGWAASTLKEFGGVQGLVVNAGGPATKTLADKWTIGTLGISKRNAPPPSSSFTA